MDNFEEIKMNQDTGEMKTVRELNDFFGGIPKGWSQFNQDELITIKNCVFRIENIDNKESRMIIKGVSKNLLKSKKE